jgi:hypothetical protein
MDAATAGLIGAGIGGAVSVTTAVVTVVANARASEHQFAREAEAKKLESLQSVLDDAGLALENMHWAIRAAVAVRPESISPNGEGRTPRTLRWAAVEAANQAWRPSSPWHAHYLRVSARHGKNPAKSSVARKLLIAAWHMLSRQEPLNQPAPANSSAF